MSGTVRWPLAEAEGIAGELLALLASSCERIEIAGSIRRKKSTCGDVELLCIPKPSDNLFHTDALDEGVTALLVASPPILAMRPSIKGITAYGPKNKLLVHVKSGIGVDIFSTDAENWGMALLIRTGSREFNIRVMARLKQLGMSGHAYPKPGQGAITSSSGADIFCPDEDIVFRNLGWAYLPPEKRQ